MPRQVISAFKVLPPFEVVEYPKTVDIKMKTPLGQEIDVSVRLLLHNSEEQYEAEAKSSIESVQEVILHNKATTMKLVTPEQLELVKKGEISPENIDKIVHNP